jgi:hypothetical protein
VASLQSEDGPLTNGESAGVPQRERKPSLPPPATNGYVERSNLNTNAIKHMTGFWHVPSSPTSGGALIYLFPGAQDQPLTRIIQPVLRWLNGAWTVANWNVDTANNFVKSADIAVSPGELLQGEMNGSNCNSSTGICSTWTLYARANNDFARSTTLTNTSTPGSAFKQVFGGALEIYSLTSCAQLPSSGITYFDGFITNMAGTDLFPNYSMLVSSVTPDCSYRASPFGSTTELAWLAGYAPYALSFDNGDSRPRSTETWDWAPGQYKAECGMADTVAGMSANPSTARAHAVLCRYNGRIHGDTGHVVDFSSTSVISGADWDVGYYKGECGNNEVVAGVSQTTSGALTRVHCKYLTAATYSGACTTRVFFNQESRGDPGGGDWSSGFFKGDCASNELVKGVSRSVSTGQTHAIRCCPVTGL